MCTGKHLAMAETAGVALVPSLYRKHGSRNWAEIRDQCTRHCDDIEFLTDDSATARKVLLASSSPASTQPIFIKSTHTELMVAFVKTSISLDRHAAHPRIGRFSKAAGTVNCGHRVSEHSGMWSYYQLERVCRTVRYMSLVSVAWPCIQSPICRTSIRRKMGW
ncbi:hypothetical protein CC77DRAFT_284544 [Alternaria alternata]|uniref:Uncharacterized protein n=1 Tax=Alternaria alternata TaxID=5599 RepID=A0A177DCM8_ALTAL|nr:hypothetical protein CC77DRAFT_284544 [Alternaria alternata]OAG17256.1 hypothetical protein CC77DRAFT_284544 [Alternaria alternata]